MPTHQLEKLNHIHLSMIELVLAGHTPQAIASATSRCVESVRMVINSPLFQEELARRRSEQNKISDQTLGSQRSQARKILENSLIRAAQTQVSLLDDADSRVKQTAVSQIFDRTFGRVSDPSTNGGISNLGVIKLEAGAVLNLQLALAEDSGSSDDDIDLIDGQLVDQSDVKSSLLGESSDTGLGNEQLLSEPAVEAA